MNNIKYLYRDDGTRKCKESEEREALKTPEQHAVELCNFLRIAFCVDEVLLTDRKSVFILGLSKEDLLESSVFEARSKTRGTFYISFTQ